MARAALGWTSREAAARAKIGLGTVCRLEADDDALASSKEKLERALAAEGVRFRNDAAGYGVYIQVVNTARGQMSLISGTDVSRDHTAMPLPGDVPRLWDEYLEAKERMEEAHRRFLAAFIQCDGPPSGS